MASVRRRVWNTDKGPKSAWIVAYLYKGKDGKTKQHIKTFATKKAAEAWRAQMTVERQKGIHTPASTSITVADAGNRWIDQATNDGLEASTLAGYEQHLRHHILPHLGGVKLVDLTAAAIADFRNTLAKGEDRKRSATTIRHVMASLGAILGHAVSLGLASRNPVREAASTQRRHSRLAARHQQRLEVGVDIPTREELKAIKRASTGRWRPLIVTAIWTALRASELRGLTWKDVDLPRAVLTVRQRADRWNTIGSPKSVAGQREVPLVKEVVNTLREWKLACPKGPLGLVFPADDGNVVALITLYRHALGQALVDAGISTSNRDPKYSLHNLRHACASLLIEAGQHTPKEIQVILGHSSIQMTFDRYGHLMSDPESSQQKMAAFEALLG
jgi:integrase